MRKASLILSSIPYAVSLVLLTLIMTSQGWEGLGMMVIAFFAMPVMMLLSAVSVLLAFLKTPDLRLDRPAKIASIVSVVIFGVLGSLAVVGMIFTMSQYSQYSQYMS